MLFGYSIVVCEKRMMALTVMHCAVRYEMFRYLLFGSPKRRVHRDYPACRNDVLVYVSP